MDIDERKQKKVYGSSRQKAGSPDCPVSKRRVPHGVRWDFRDRRKLMQCQEIIWHGRCFRDRHDHRPGALPALRREVTAVDPGVPINEDYEMSDRVTFEFQRVRIAMTMLGAFGVFALILCSIGVFGVVSFVASMRTREIAIRVALGAGQSHVRRMVVGDGLRLAIPGAIVGIGGALLASSYLGSLLYGVDPHDPVVFGAVSATLVAVVLVASYVPMRRSARIDPSVALRRD